ncbi:MAG: BF3164 family lipoprotein [Bacteroidales bacterium]|nr:BF3164 family lipoprotein [Bacteroidales bacterium]MDD3893293.1 BF3164 family lipoprotein [Bacteroidales bacterium]
MKSYSHLFAASFLCLTIIAACNDKTEEEKFKDKFQNKKTLTLGESIELNNKYVNTLQLIINDSLALFKHKQSECFFSIYNLNKNKVEQQFAPIGKGPEEMILAGSIWIDYKTNTFYAYDVSKQKLFLYSIGCLLSHSNCSPQILDIKSPDSVKSIYSMAPVNEVEVICTGSFYDGSLAHFNYRETVTKGFYGHYFVDEKYKDTPNWLLGHANQGKVLRKPNGNKFVNAAYYCGHIEFFSIDNGKYKLNNSHTIHPTIFGKIDFPNGHSTAALKRENRLGFIDVSFNKDFCFALYSGRSMKDYGNECAYGRDIYVFTWEGKPTFHYQLEKDANSIAISNDGKHLYVLTVEDDFSLLKFTLNLD